MTLAIYLPERKLDRLALDLVDLTEAICNKIGSDGGGGLGGRYGYGEEYENDAFMMHPFCWCDSPTCPWCYSCDCEYTDAENWEDMRLIKECDNCSNLKTPQPNFLYKPEGFSVSWYKYIGRDMEVNKEPPKNWLDHCLNSLNI